jgi:hypothetical protein
MAKRGEVAVVEIEPEPGAGDEPEPTPQEEVAMIARLLVQISARLTTVERQADELLSILTAHQQALGVQNQSIDLLLDTVTDSVLLKMATGAPQ